MIQKNKNIYHLKTRNTSYVFHVTRTGHLEHLYYGAALKRVTQADARAMSEKRVFPAGNVISYDPQHSEVMLEDLCLEMSSRGKGDIREPFVEVVCSDGGRTSDFLYEAYSVSAQKDAYETLPGSVSDGTYEHLCITLRDAAASLLMELHYYVYPDCDVICRSTRLINEGERDVRILRLMSMQLDLESSGYAVSAFTGAWAREMDRTDTAVAAGKYVISSSAGTSSNRANPFFMLHRPDTSERFGECWGFNLIYSGNHYELVEVNSFGKTRVLSGINPAGFSWRLAPGEAFEAPEAVMSWSDQGFTGISTSMHRFVRKHIVRGPWRDQLRPVLLNSWEAAYFHFDESKLLRLAKAGRKAGIELFVMDDGWFGARNDDTSSLGDWYVNKKKLPGGLEGICRKINDLGMDFGIWVEPEMVNTNSDLYRNHPQWIMQIPGREHSEGRNQRILDLANPEVADYITGVMASVFSSADIKYVKWDMNRIFSDVWSPYLPADRQGETAHRYICGLYRILRSLTERFPQILFEGCASGGNRFDLGMLCYFPQIWASDNTDAICRASIQEGYSYGYPMSVVSAHVSAVPNHQTQRITPLDTRFAVAAFGLLGYECNLSDMKKEDLDKIRLQIELYKEWRKVLQRGSFYRGRIGAGLHEWICVSEDKTKAAGMLMQELIQPNTQYEYFRAAGLKSTGRYRFRDMTAGFRDMPGETEEVVVSGDVLMNAGIKRSKTFTGMGNNGNVRAFGDFSARLYLIEELAEKADSTQWQRGRNA